MDRQVRDYHIFLFLTSFARGLVSVFSLIILYQKGYSLQSLLFFLFLLYFIGIFVNIFSLLFPYRIVLILSSVFYGVSYLYLSFMDHSLFSLILFSFLLSISTYSYHVIRHYLALSLFSNSLTRTNGLVFVMHLGGIIASVMGTFLISKLPIYVSGLLILGLSILSVFSIFRGREDSFKNTSIDLFLVKMDLSKVLFSVFEQFKVLFLELQPLFLYLCVKDSILYVGGLLLIVSISSLIIAYFIGKRMKVFHFFFFCCFLFVVLMVKIHFVNDILLLFLSFLEGIGIRGYDVISLNNLYDLGKNDVKSYLMVEEIIFFLTKSLLMGLFLVFRLRLYWILLICNFGILVSGFFLHEKKAS